MHTIFVNKTNIDNVIDYGYTMAVSSTVTLISVLGWVVMAAIVSALVLTVLGASVTGGLGTLGLGAAGFFLVLG